MSRVFMAVLVASAVALSGCGRDQDQAENQYGENEARTDRYGSAERYGDANAETRTGSMAQAGQLMVPQDSFIEVSLNDGLNSQTAKKGDEFTAEVVEPVKVSDQEAIPAGATIHGVVKDVFDPASKPQTGASSTYPGSPDSQSGQAGSQTGATPGAATPGTQDMNKARLTLAFTRIEFPDGYTTNIVASLPQPSEVQMARNRGLGGGSAAGGEVLGRRGEDDKDADKAGDKAMAKEKDFPADIQSGAVGTGIVVARNGQHVNLPAGTELTIQLDEPLRIPAHSERNKGMGEKQRDKDRWDSDPNRN